MIFKPDKVRLICVPSEFVRILDKPKPESSLEPYAPPFVLSYSAFHGQLNMRTYLFLYFYIAAYSVGVISASDVDEQLVLTDNISDFDVYASKWHEGYSVRIKEQNSSLCNTTSRQFTGWLDFDGKSIFFCKSILFLAFCQC